MYYWPLMAELSWSQLIFEKLGKLWGGLDTNSAGDNFCELKLKFPIGPVIVMATILLVLVRELSRDSMYVVRDRGSNWKQLILQKSPLLFVTLTCGSNLTINSWTDLKELTVLNYHQTHAQLTCIQRCTVGNNIIIITSYYCENIIQNTFLKSHWTIHCML